MLHVWSTTAPPGPGRASRAHRPDGARGPDEGPGSGIRKVASHLRGPLRPVRASTTTSSSSESSSKGPGCCRGAITGRSALSGSWAEAVTSTGWRCRWADAWLSQSTSPPTVTGSAPARGSTYIRVVSWLRATWSVRHGVRCASGRACGLRRRALGGDAGRTRSDHRHGRRRGAHVAASGAGLCAERRAVARPAGRGPGARCASERAASPRRRGCDCSGVASSTPGNRRSTAPCSTRADGGSARRTSSTRGWRWERSSTGRSIVRASGIAATYGGSTTSKERLEFATFVGDDLDDEQLVIDRLLATRERAGRLPRRWRLAPLRPEPRRAPRPSRRDDRARGARARRLVTLRGPQKGAHTSTWASQVLVSPAGRGEPSPASHNDLYLIVTRGGTR